MLSQKLWVREKTHGIVEFHRMRRISTRAMAHVATRSPEKTPRELACGIPVHVTFRNDDDDAEDTDFIDDVIDNLRVNLLRRTFPLTTASDNRDIQKIPRAGAEPRTRERLQFIT